MFGEIGVIFGCRRTASIVSKAYGICARIHATSFYNLVKDYPEFKDYLEQQYITDYDDESKIFKVLALR